MEPQYDAFISYSSRDRDWIENWLLPHLESAGVKVCIDFRDFDVGGAIPDNIDDAVARSNKLIVVFTPNWVKSEWTAFEAILAQTSDPAAIRRRILPLMLADCDPPHRLAHLDWADFRDPSMWETEIKRMIRAINPSPTLNSRPPATDSRQATSDQRTPTTDRTLPADGSTSLAPPSSPQTSVRTGEQSGGMNITGGQFSGNAITARDSYEIHGNVSIYQSGSGPTVNRDPETPPNHPLDTRSESSAQKRLSVFVSHAVGDEALAADLYDRLQADGFAPWLDTKNILPGQQPESEISRAVRRSDIVLVCLSQNAVNKAGHVHKEIRLALDIADEQPEETIFLIPVKLEPCDLPDRLSHLAPVNLYEPNGYARLVNALNRRAKSANN